MERKEVTAKPSHRRRPPKKGRLRYAPIYIYLVIAIPACTPARLEVVNITTSYTEIRDTTGHNVIIATSSETHRKVPRMAYGLEWLAAPVIGALTAEWNDRRQLEQQQKLMQMQVQGQKEMGLFNQQLALDTWEKTNYAAQRRQMEKAGLNVGLMYSKGGAGGTTQGGSPGSVTGGQAPAGGGEMGMGIGMAMQLKMMQAQIAKTEAETEQIKGTTPGKTKGAEQEARLTELHADLTELERDVKTSNYHNLVNQFNALAWKTVQEAYTAETGAEVAAGTAEARIQQAKLDLGESAMRILAQKAGIYNTQADTTNKQEMRKLLVQELFDKKDINGKSWREYSLEEKRVAIQKRQQELQESTFDWNMMNQSVDKIIGIFDTVADLVGTMNAAPKIITNKAYINSGKKP